jgi:hypothetical protein
MVDRKIVDSMLIQGLHVQKSGKLDGGFGHACPISAHVLTDEDMGAYYRARGNKSDTLRQTARSTSLFESSIDNTTYMPLRASETTKQQP